MGGSGAETAGSDANTSVRTATLGQLFRYATAFDVACLVVGFLGAGAVGAAQPCMMVLFGDLMDVLGLQAAGKAMEESFNLIARNMVLLGAGCFVCAWIGEACFKVSGLRQSAMWRKTYLEAILRQEIGWFDTNNPGELSSKIAENTQLIEEGIGSKLTLGSRNLMQGLVGMFIAFWYAWDMGLVLMAISPVAIFGAWYFSYSATTASTETSKAYAKAGGTASESLSELRTIAALGAEAKQADKYAGSLGQARDAGIRKSYRCGFANGLLFSSGNLMAAAGFLYGASKIKRALENSFKEGFSQYDPDGMGGWKMRAPGATGANCANGGDKIGTFICVHRTHHNSHMQCHCKRCSPHTCLHRTCACANN
jgi:ATP-binding cassette subfamily B (MDR/TAP) protein 1